MFASVLDQSDEDKDIEVSVFAVRVVMSLIMLILSEAFIPFISVPSLKMSVKHAIHLLFIFQFSGYVYLIHCLIIDFISSSDSSKRSLSSWPDCLNF